MWGGAGQKPLAASEQGRRGRPFARICLRCFFFSETGSSPTRHLLRPDARGASDADGEGHSPHVNWILHVSPLTRERLLFYVPDESSPLAWRETEFTEKGSIFSFVIIHMIVAF